MSFIGVLFVALMSAAFMLLAIDLFTGAVILFVIALLFAILALYEYGTIERQISSMKRHIMELEIEAEKRGKEDGCN